MNRYDIINTIGDKYRIGNTMRPHFGALDAIINQNTEKNIREAKKSKQ